jgi:hypothetical protein
MPSTKVKNQLPERTGYARPFLSKAIAQKQRGLDQRDEACTTVTNHLLVSIVRA